ncbi:MAG: hypothetical protein IIT58_05300 [Treponema sp.]|nr:hypothetical protein [Treponema sp.]
MKNSKRFCFVFFSLLSSFCFSEASENLKSFIKASIQEKAFIVKQAPSSESAELSKAAIDFALSNKELLGDDRELSALVVAGILSMPKEYVDSLSQNDRNFIADKFLSVYTTFDDENVKTAVLNKIEVLQLPGYKFTTLLNDYIRNSDFSDNAPVSISTSIKALQNIGNEESFEIVHEKLQDKNWKDFSDELTKTFTKLSEKYSKQLYDIIQKSSVQECQEIYTIFLNNKEISKVFLAELSENVLVRTIYIVEENSSVTNELIALQLESYNVLTKLNWPRSASACLLYFKIAKQEYEQNMMHEDNFAEIIKGLPVVAPMDCVQPLSDYLAEINKNMEKSGSLPSEKIVLEIITSLGAIGDKNAFDSLLGVTYYNYSDTVIAEARSALAKLKW